MEIPSKKAIVFIHGKNGNPDEAEHYRQFFPEYEVIGFDYHSDTPWDAVDEFSSFFDSLQRDDCSISIIANSIGAYFAMNSLSDIKIEKAYFISPIVNMEQLISDMMCWAGISEQELSAKGLIETSFGETLSWQYLSWVREHPISWAGPTYILYGSCDNLQTIDSVRRFSEETGAALTVMPGGEHWFHTNEQMRFLDEWIYSSINER